MRVDGGEQSGVTYKLVPEVAVSKSWILLARLVQSARCRLFQALHNLTLDSLDVK